MPKGQSLKDLAVHKATMVIFLSASLTEKVQNDLIEGGYSENTPCAIVYKATWSDEKVIRGQLSNLLIWQGKYITKTALIVVGDVLGSDYELSKLYDKNFKTEYRK